MVSPRDPLRRSRREELDRTEAPAGLTPYLLPSERLVVAIHQHWAITVPPVAAVACAFVLALWTDAHATKSVERVADGLWWVFFATLVYAAWRLLEWRLNWFAATDKRLLLTHGLLTRKVSMMPLSKVTDMSFTRTVPARLLGYGLFVLESAGQDQALREINWVPSPEATYRAICSEIFGDARAANGQDANDSWEEPWEDEGDGPGATPHWGDETPHWGDESSHDGLDSPDAGVHGLREAPRIAPLRDGESLYRSDPDEGDTGPIRYL